MQFAKFSLVRFRRMELCVFCQVVVDVSPLFRQIRAKRRDGHSRFGLVWTTTMDGVFGAFLAHFIYLGVSISLGLCLMYVYKLGTSRLSAFSIDFVLHLTNLIIGGV